MKAWLKVLNYILLAFFGITVLKLGLIQPARSIPAVLNLIPFGLALLAAQPNGGVASARSAIILNALWALLYAGAMAWLIFFNRSAVLASALFVPVIFVMLLNCKALRSRGFATVRS